MRSNSGNAESIINYKLEYQIMLKKMEIFEERHDEMRQAKQDLVTQNEQQSQQLEVQQDMIRQMKSQIEYLEAQLQERQSKSSDSMIPESQELRLMLSGDENQVNQELYSIKQQQNEEERSQTRGRSSIQFNSQVTFIEDQSKLTQSQQASENRKEKGGYRKSFYKPVDRDLKRRMDAIYSTSESFFQDNGITFEIEDSPFYRVHVSRVEKRAENTRSFLKSFAKTLQELVKKGEIYSVTLKQLSDEISSNLHLVEDNKELFSMFSYTSEFFKDLTTFYEALNFNLILLAIEPLKEYAKPNLDHFKDLKKKSIKLTEEFETVDFKIMQTKKQSLTKDKNNFNQVQKNHLIAEKAHDQARFELTSYMNKLQFEMNEKISNSICAVLQSFTTFNEQQLHENRQLDSYLRLFKKPENLKNEYLEEMQHRLNILKSKVESQEKNPLNLTDKKKDKARGQYLLLKSKKEKAYKRRFFQIDRGNFFSIKIKKNIIVRSPISPLGLINFNENPESEFIHVFELISPQTKQPLLLVAPSLQSLQEWKKAFFVGTESYLAKGPQMRDRDESNQDELIYQIIQKNTCADCSKADPSWVSLNLCVIVCLECSGIHRKLGPNISKVRSLKLDNISDDILDFFLYHGTQQLNEIWEKNTHSFQQKPSMEGSSEVKYQWIKQKYVDQKFIEKDISSNFVDLMFKAISNCKILDLIHAIISRGVLLDKTFPIQNKVQSFLHLACSISSVKIVSLLLQMGADINILDEEKKRPIEIAKQTNNSEIFSFLLSKE